MEQWRLLVTPDLPGALNMAIDQVIADTVKDGVSPPTLRFFTWRPFCLSLGYHQKAQDVNFDKCASLGIDVVRRPTGGRAVYHSSEFTYSVVASSDSSVYQPTLEQTYLVLARWLLNGLQRLGVKADLAPPLSSDHKKRLFSNPSCFSSTSDYEITVLDKKLIGSAQRRWQNGFLQHGSFLLDKEFLKIVDLLRLSENSRNAMNQYLASHTIWLRKITGQVPQFDELVSVFVDAWESEFGIRLLPDELSDQELEKARQLHSKFAVAPDLSTSHSDLARSSVSSTQEEF